MVVRVAMWSGPRNVSTALMRSFGARRDTWVVDEPLYAHYLAATGIDHPGREDILSSQPQRWEDAVAALTAPVPSPFTVHYQKHMAHHLLPGVGRDWLAPFHNAYLIRDPAAVIASYAKVRGEPTLEDLGYPQQLELFRSRGGPVVDAADLLSAPENVLPALCETLRIPYDKAMLTWPPGPRETDGVWSPHWYSAVIKSTGFAPYTPQTPEVPEHLLPLLNAAQPYYDELATHKINPA
jgi:hypothetical protein